MTELTPELLLRAYAVGIFPMAQDARSQELFWFDPERRGILPIEGFHLPRRLAKAVRRRLFDVTIDTDFEGVIRGCAEPAPDRPKTWINGEILNLYCALHRMGHAHSVECRLDGRLVGGLYGVSLGGAFFGESMFSRVADASKVALVHLVARLDRNGFALLDSQFVTEHLKQFGAIEIPRADYRARLARAIRLPADFGAGDQESVIDAYMQSRTQTS